MQKQKLAWLYSEKQRMQEGNFGLANPYAFLVGAKDDRKATPGITELSRLRVQIDGAVCYIDVGSS